MAHLRKTGFQRAFIFPDVNIWITDNSGEGVWMKRDCLFSVGWILLSVTPKAEEEEVLLAPSNSLKSTGFRGCSCTDLQLL